MQFSGISGGFATQHIEPKVRYGLDYFIFVSTLIDHCIWLRVKTHFIMEVLFIIERFGAKDNVVTIIENFDS